MPTKEQLKIRKAATSDVESLHNFGCKTFADAFNHLYRPGDLAVFQAEAHSQAAYRALICDQSKRVWVAETDERHLVGYAVASPCTLPVTPMPEGALQLDRIYVSSDYQGAGIGVALMDQFLDWAASQGDPPTFLGVYYDNIGAHRFYQRYGFRHVGEYDFHVGDQIDREFIFRRG